MEGKSNTGDYVVKDDKTEKLANETKRKSHNVSLCLIFHTVTSAGHVPTTTAVTSVKEQIILLLFTFHFILIS